MLTAGRNTQILAQAEGGDPQQILDARVLKHDSVTRAVLLSREDASVLASSKPALKFSESEARDLIDALRASQAQNDPTSVGQSKPTSVTIDGEKASVGSFGDDVLIATAGDRVRLQRFVDIADVGQVFAISQSARSILVAEGAKGSEEVLKTVAQSFSESVSKNDL